MLAFKEEILTCLESLLEDDGYYRTRVNVNERSLMLMTLHEKFISLAQDKMTANEIARRLFIYDTNLRSK